MATIKAFTSLEQSKKLAEILPLESADMHIIAEDVVDEDTGDIISIELTKLGAPSSFDFPCWSLAALLNVLPNDNSKCTTITRGRYNTITRKYISGWCVYYNEINGANCMNVFAENPVDACVAMIEKLHELKML